MNLKEIENKSALEIEKAKDARELEAAKIKYLGRNGFLSKFMKTIPSLPLEERKVVGKEANGVKNNIERFLIAKAGSFKEKATEEFFDVTRPGKKIKLGHEHPLAKVDEEVRRIFTSMNFSVVWGPELETEYYNFDALNIPANHPARDMWDTFWVKTWTDKLLLRTHTSPVQVRYMEKHEPPFQIIVPGRVFRYEATDASHEINFYQVEGLMVGPNVTLANLKFVIEKFFEKFFGESGRRIEFRYRPSYFPFTEPSLEVDIKIGGKWLEVIGAGMVHRNVFDAVRYNPDTVQGFAFGMGLDRLAMIKYQIPDIRMFYEGDLRFIHQF